MMPKEPTKADLCSPFNGNETACYTAATACWKKDKFSKEKLIKCVHARAPKRPTESKLAARAELPTEPKLPTKADLPTEAELCEPFNGDRNTCITTIDLCRLLNGRQPKEEMIKCVHDFAESGLTKVKQSTKAKLPTGPGITPESDLCDRFNSNKTACITATTMCSNKVAHTAEAMIECVYAVAAAAAAAAAPPEIPTVAEVCPQANSKKQYQDCSNMIKICAKDHKTREAISKCVHDNFALIPERVQVTKADVCPPFNGNETACMEAIRVCYKDNGNKYNKKKMVECVKAIAAAAAKERTKTDLSRREAPKPVPKFPTRAETKAELPTEAELCPPFDGFGGTEACKTATEACYKKDRHASKDTIIKCVHADAKRTEEELCQPFNGGTKACKAATTLCFGQHNTKVERIKCVHAAAAAAAERPTNEELCPPFNGDMKACRDARAVCAYGGKRAREAMIKCVHDIAAAIAIDNQLTDADICPPFNGNAKDCSRAREWCTYEGKLTREAMIKCVLGLAASYVEGSDDSPIWDP
ncbi:hypothetical protein MHUMG1_02278 [Metarhizium humberi]|uniref:Uncharacterized protein n=1 Tax=Metarhizium humberi TaxID=2596975 RepID=A0A9P8MEX7_9HYPO|nr:hypothetical protein MHUMG1_02278 [Metarhizium humberi]